MKAPYNTIFRYTTELSLGFNVYKNFVCYSNEQGSSTDALLQTDEQAGRIHVDADMRYCRLLFQEC